MIQFNNIIYIWNTSARKKKAGNSSGQIKKLNLIDEDSQKNLKFLSDQKNQLEIEKKNFKVNIKI